MIKLLLSPVFNGIMVQDKYFFVLDQSFIHNVIFMVYLTEEYQIIRNSWEDFQKTL